MHRMLETKTPRTNKKPDKNTQNKNTTPKQQTIPTSTTQSNKGGPTMTIKIEQLLNLGYKKHIICVCTKNSTPNEMQELNNKLTELFPQHTIHIHINCEK